MLLNYDVGEDSSESLGLQRDKTSQSERKSVQNIHWKDWCWSSNTFATWCEKLTHQKRPWCWERFKAGEGDNRGWDGWMASLTRWTWVWANPGRWWRTGKPGMLQFMGLQIAGQSWVTEQLCWIQQMGCKRQKERTAGKMSLTKGRNLVNSYRAGHRRQQGWLI